jgi:hypothetical protein
VREEVLVLGGQNRVAEDGRHFVVGDDSAVFPGQLDEDRAPGVIDLADRGELEANEGSMSGSPVRSKYR